MMIRCFWVVWIALVWTSSVESKQKLPGWDPKGDHPCNIEQISMKDFIEKYGQLESLFPRPLIISNNVSDTSNLFNKRNQHFRNLARSDSILRSFPENFNITLSSSNSFSEHRRDIPLASYLEEVRVPTNAEMKSNETWYLFGETFSPEWKSFLRSYELPPCQACNIFDEFLVALSFGIGSSGSGVSWHIHGPGFLEAIHGRKHWILYSPENRPDFHPDQTSLNWMHYNYSIIEKIEDRPLQCTLFPGDILYFPDMWWHATVNVDDYSAFVSTFTQEHVFVERKRQRILEI
mmetsp:Transcript_31846/g.35479  ORF Transcript_31846/g.35479 Transcript_31846/m.35479 type:complete len:291 (+) Transcript_31846:170-1042(+)